MKTALEFLQQYKNNTEHYADQEFSEDRIVDAMKQFCILHLKDFKDKIDFFTADEFTYGEVESLKEEIEFILENHILKIQ
mgnify:CR=1 FL=1